MAEIIVMPKQGQSVESCLVTKLHKKEGDPVKKGDILFSYETDKATFEEESPIDGIVHAVFAQEGDEIPVLAQVMVIGTHGEEKKISPRAKNVAENNAVDVAKVKGTGPGGRVIERDVQEAMDNQPRMTSLAKKLASEKGNVATSAVSGIGGRARSVDFHDSEIPEKQPARALAGGDYEDIPLSNVRKLIARSMHASLQNSAQLTHHLGADARAMLAQRKAFKLAFEKEEMGVNITLNDLVCFAVVKALKKYPHVNSHFLGDSLRVFNKVHLGVAVDTDRGLMVPMISDADDLSIEGLASRLKEVAHACRSGSVNPDILSPEAASFTVSNLGNYGVEMFTPVINLPQTAILGVNTITPRPKDLGEGVYAFVPYMGLSLTYDHRALDGGEASRFLKQIAQEIEQPIIK